MTPFPPPTLPAERAAGVSLLATGDRRYPKKTDYFVARSIVPAAQPAGKVKPLRGGYTAVPMGLAQGSEGILGHLSAATVELKKFTIKF